MMKHNPIADMYVEGPQNVRTYTVDPESKREQLQAIEAMIEKADRDREESHRHIERRCFAVTEARSGKLTAKYVAPPVRGDLDRKHRRPVSQKSADTPFRLHLRPVPPQSLPHNQSMTSL